MAAGHAWVLNLDADLELGARGPSYTPAARVVAQMGDWQRQLAALLLGPEDVLIHEGREAGAARGCIGRAFCMTRRARALLERAGASPEPSPPVEVLAQVNDRAFAFALGFNLPGAELLFDAEAVAAKLATPPPSGYLGWRMKRRFGMAGRGQRVVRGEVSEVDVRFLRASVEPSGSGLVVEPEADVEREYGLHGYVESSGSLRLGSVVVQHCDARGQWSSTARAALEELSRAEADQLIARAELVAAALVRAGYFGPFGIDAFRHRAAPGGTELHSLSEINARYSMGFAVGFGRPPPPRSP